ncbi:hypothetical protein CH252_24515 [Rhodococcus sp. 06-1477-1B]|nr:hypothetical protein CH252_24515 [Rhodococcus sp. 06-1477-1B]
MPLTAVAWVVVLSTAISNMAMMRTAGDLVDAASVSTIATFFAVPVLAGFSVLLDARHHHSAARVARNATFGLVGLVLAVVSVLLAAAVAGASGA